MNQEPKFPECQSCRYFAKNVLIESARCRSCGAGEFYEEKFQDSSLDDNELMRIFSRMKDDNQD